MTPTRAQMFSELTSDLEGVDLAITNWITEVMERFLQDIANRGISASTMKIHGNNCLILMHALNREYGMLDELLGDTKFDVFLSVIGESDAIPMRSLDRYQQRSVDKSARMLYRWILRQPWRDETPPRDQEYPRFNQAYEDMIAEADALPPLPDDYHGYRLSREIAERAAALQQSRTEN